MGEVPEGMRVRAGNAREVASGRRIEGCVFIYEVHLAAGGEHEVLGVAVSMDDPFIMDVPIAMKKKNKKRKQG